MTQRLSYRTVLPSQTGTCSGVHPISIEGNTTSVIGFINKCIEDVVPTVTVRAYHNQKPWITGNTHTELKARTDTFKERNTNPDAYNEFRYALRRTIKQAKRHPSHVP